MEIQREGHLASDFGTLSRIPKGENIVIFVYLCETLTLSELLVGLSGIPRSPPSAMYLNRFSKDLCLPKYSMSGATGVRCCIDAEDSQPRSNHVYHLSSFKASDSSFIVDAVILTMTKIGRAHV